ncbi:MAG: hypothetical protein R3C01_09600 [Planctomycetaceae bacterium]
MTRILNITSTRNLFVAALVTGTMAFASGTASASGCHAPRCYWKTVTVYVSVEKPCVHYITKYTSCGRPYQVQVVTYKTVQVPVQKQVKVCY